MSLNGVSMLDGKNTKERSGRDVLESIESSIEQLVHHATSKDHTTQITQRVRESGDLKELYKALHSAQRMFKELEKTGLIAGRNIPYAKINDLIDASRSALHAYDLVVSTYHSTYPNNFTTLTTRLYHFPSGQFIESELPLLNNTEEQKRGSSITYAWRYTYAPLIGLVDSSYDDDGEITKQYTPFKMDTTK